MINYQHLYQTQGVQYQRLIDREDYQGNLLNALEKIIEFPGKDLLDLGAGTGRISLMVADKVKSITALDSSRHMLSIAHQQLANTSSGSWIPAVADHRHLPLLDDHYDLIISAWSFSYLKTWAEGSWRDEINQGLGEIERVLHPEGTVVLIETLGTGWEFPQAPQELQDYYEHLEMSGYQSTWIRTDYQFRNHQEAVDLVKFFFGPELLDFISIGKAPILPECTGIWWK